jgi:hypothetical protein
MSEHVQFGRIPYAMAAAGMFSGLSGSASSVYLMLAAHDDVAWTANPGTKRIAELLKIEERTVRRALAALKRRGLIVTRKTGGGHGLRTTYRLVTNPDEADRVQHGGSVTNPDEANRVSQSETRTEHDQEPGRSEPKTRSAGVRNPDNAAPQNRENRAQQQSCNTAAAGHSPAADKESGAVDRMTDTLEALAEAGIGDPKRSELATAWSELPNAAQRIRDLAASLRARGKGTGAVVLELEARAEAARARGRNEAAARANADARHREQAQAEAAASAKRAADKRCVATFIAALTDAEYEAAEQQVFNSAEHNNPLFCDLLKKDKRRGGGERDWAVWKLLHGGNGQPVKSLT